MKLNNKGFAFSTILYGCFSLIVIILLILLSIMRTSVQFTDYYSEKIKNNLTNCLEEEIALENCYATSQICDTKAYAACMGYDEVGEVQNAYSLKDTLDKIINLNGQGTNGLYKEGNKFLYKGNADATIYNYLTYEGELFRIISVDESGQIKALYKGFDENISFDKDNTGSVTYSASSIRQVLNNSVINIFPNKELFVQKLVSENTVLLTSTSTYKTLQSGEIKNNTTEVNYLTLLEIEDIVNASLQAGCNSSITTNKCSSWISPTWLNEIVLEAAQTTSNNVLYFDGEYVYKVSAKEITKCSSNNTTKNCKASPVVTFDSKTRISTGDGSIGSPYVVAK